ncbi:hypothetical protein [Cohnella abietis]|uniref:Uncharacterized protein n=1 Tax=Cohnella abietis TaxID=2507935 RepID=A0A3T1D7S9_9BACL|nr:hypothetical protein [Cohnella abietis]BBI34140.1 hypothetical protein KCTCHS21_35390 [Cohnella abietis]
MGSSYQYVEPFMLTDFVKFSPIISENKGYVYQSLIILIMKGCIKMRNVIILCFLIILMMGCQSKENKPYVKEVSSELFTLRVKIEQIEKSQIRVSSELVYKGDKSIKFVHSDPLVGAALGDGITRPDIIYSFVGTSGTLEKNQVYSDGKERVFEIGSKDKILYTQAFFTSNDEKKVIDLEINLDEIS